MPPVPQIQINSVSIFIWPVQNFLTVANSIVNGRNGLYKIFLSIANSIASARNGLYKIYVSIPQIQINSFSISICPETACTKFMSQFPRSKSIVFPSLYVLYKIF